MHTKGNYCHRSEESTVIKNEKQYKITKGLMTKFQKSLKELDKLPASKEQPWLRSAQENSILNQLEQLCEEVEEYEALKNGKVKVTLPSLEAIMELPALLIKRRIANGWTQEQLAHKLDMHGQQLQRYEQSDYSAASLATIQRVAAVLMETGSNPRKTKSAAPRKPSPKKPAKSATGIASGSARKRAAR
jgi:DNA-binding XRE family transcriptional regulator